MASNGNVQGDVATDETDRLIAANKVEGTAVYGRDGERLGTVDTFMVDKRTGKAEYAVLSFGGFLGIGEDHYPVPWEALTYDTGHGGYVTDIDRDQLENAPHYGAGETPRFDQDYSARISSAYGGGLEGTGGPV